MIVGIGDRCLRICRQGCTFFLPTSSEYGSTWERTGRPRRLGRERRLHLSTPSTPLARTSSRAAESEPNRVFLSGKPATRIGSCGMTQIWRLWRSSRLPSTKYASSCALKGVARRLLMEFRSTGLSRRKRSSRSTRGCISSHRRSLAPTGISLSTRRHTTSTPPALSAAPLPATSNR